MALSNAARPSHSDWIDISVTLKDGMVHWPGDAPFQTRRISDVERGDAHNLSEISLGSHSGTHIDAPLHFIKGGMSIADMPLDTMVGRARVIEIQDSQLINVEEMMNRHIRPGERILFKTRNSTSLGQSKEFAKDFVSISREAAEFLVGHKVKAVGVDYLSVGGYNRDGGEIHRILLGAGIWIIEGLDLSQTRDGNYALVCLPLKIWQGDGAPARAMVRRI